MLTLLALTTFCVGTVRGQSDMLPMSRTVGSISLTLPKNATTLVALPNVKIVADGTISAVAGDNLTVASTPAVLPDVSGSAYAIKITSRNSHAAGSTNAYGLSATITAQAGQEVTADLSTAPNVGDSFVIYELSTIADIFGANNSAGLHGGITPAVADIVSLTSGGEIIGYFYNTSANAWRLVSAPDGANQGDTVIESGSGVMVTRQDEGSAITLRLSGEVVTGRHAANVGSGFSIVNNPFLIPTTLAASSLQDNITGGTGPGAADIVYLESAGELTGYYYKTGGIGGTGWRALGDNVTDQGATIIAPGKAILFKEIAGSAGFALPEPFAE
ncbi:hypothetical protein [Prosthecobacter sp. SYSU 5D2]|uniref:hypothetical protein n=1 Tax=Prosthecobacter sp. SYSU 5D2 TaxID=3134134 RepID=UPI0031FED6FA